MKKLFTAALLAVTLTTSAFATDESQINVRIRQNFKDEFKGADKVDWTLRQDFVKATFVLNGKQVNAFYDFQGEMIGKSHSIALEDLSINARRSIAKKYTDYKITEAVEFNGKDGDAYYISLENDNEAIVVKVTETSSMSLFKKTRKK